MLELVTVELCSLQTVLQGFEFLELERPVFVVEFLAVVKQGGIKNS